MIIDCIADPHGHYPELEGGDLLIVAGDLTIRDTFDHHCDFKKWLYDQSYRKKVVIAGNHDNHLVGLIADSYAFSSFNTKNGEQLSFAEYLCDSGCEFEGLKIWGSPWTKTFEGMNPKCKAFTCDIEEELASKFSLIPDDIDILVTHSPAYGVLDELVEEGKHAGSIALENKIKIIKPRIHIFGHIHESYGQIKKRWWPKLKPINKLEDERTYFVKDTFFINASLVNEHYQPVNKPVRVIL